MPDEKLRLSRPICSPEAGAQRRNPGECPADLPGFRCIASGLRVLRSIWRAVRHLSGDDAYERYLEHHAAHHVDEPPPTRAEFFRRWQDEKWNGTRRCC